MLRKKQIISLVFLGFSILLTSIASAADSAPEFYKNDPKNLNEDPNYSPGDVPLNEIFPAQTVYYAKKTELIQSVNFSEKNFLTTLDVGEISFSIMKNKTVPVLGYFRNYFGILSVGADKPERMDMIIDVNSLDTGVPGRNNRILNIFFESMKPDFGTAFITFNSFDMHDKSLSDMSVMELSRIEASGTLTLNGETKDISAYLAIKKEGDTWVVETEEPIQIKISDFGFGDRVYELMKSCNHQSMGNTVDVKVKLYLK